MKRILIYIRIIYNMLIRWFIWTKICGNSYNIKVKFVKNRNDKVRKKLYYRTNEMTP